MTTYCADFDDFHPGDHRLDFLAWALDGQMRLDGSSGGFVRAMLAWLLESGRVDAALVARTGPPGEFAPGYAVVNNPEELRSRRYCSVYYPTDPFNTVLAPGLRYALVTLPCRVERLRNLQRGGAWPQVRYVFELLCSGVPRPEWTNRLRGGAAGEWYYRGDGWPNPPGTWTDKDVMPCCLECRRTCCGADWTCADPWGYPAKKIGDGKTLVRAHTREAVRLTGEAVIDFAVAVETDGGLMARRLNKHARRR